MKNKVCRLCSSTNNLIDIFNSGFKYPEKLQLWINSGSGINISKNDSKSKMVCIKCCQTAITIHELHTSSIVDVKDIKLKKKTTSTKSINNKINNINKLLTPKHKEKQDLHKSVKTIKKKRKENETKNKNLKSAVKNLTDKPQSKKHSNNDLLNTLKPYDVKIAERLKTNLLVSDDEYKHHVTIPKHPSVQNLLNTYKNITIPKKMFRCDVSPVIMIDSMEVHNWFMQRLRYLRQKLQSATENNKNRITNNIIREKVFRKRKRQVLYSEEDSDQDNRSSKKRRMQSKRKIKHKDQETDNTTEIERSSSGVVRKKRCCVIYSDSDSGQCEINKTLSGNCNTTNQIQNLIDNRNTFMQDELSTNSNQQEVIENNQKEDTILLGTSSVNQNCLKVNIPKPSDISNLSLVTDANGRNNEMLENEYITADDEKVVQYFFNKHYQHSDLDFKDDQLRVIDTENDGIRLKNLGLEIKRYNIPVKFRYVPTVAVRIVPNPNVLQQNYEKKWTNPSVISDENLQTSQFLSNTTQDNSNLSFHMSRNVFQHRPATFNVNGHISNDLNTHRTIEYKNGEAYKLFKVHDNIVQSLRIVLPVDMQSSAVDRNPSSSLQLETSNNPAKLFQLDALIHPQRNTIFSQN